MDGSPFLGVERSVTGRRWRVRAADEGVALALSRSLGVPDLVGRVMAARGVTPETGASYLSPTLRDLLPDPSRFRDMDRAAARLAEAVIQGAKVAVFGDYDVDGATSSALLQRYFQAVGGTLEIYIPDRLTEGYGPNLAALEGLAQGGAEVIITVDCGTVAFDVLDQAAAQGIAVIVVDHHLAEPRLPKALAVINPNRLDDPSGQGQLAAVGVAFLLVVALNRALRQAGFFSADRPEPDLAQWLDLVALGTVADVVPLTGVNRALVTQGLKILARRRNPGLAALADVAGMNEPPGAYHLGFLLGPRVNAGGRVGRADLGARLLTTEDADEAGRLAAELNRLNLERRAIETAVLDQALAPAEAAVRAGRPVVVAAGEGWHPGVVGIVASRIKDRVRRPCFVLGLADGIAKGSGRSIAGVDLGAAVTAARQAGLLINGGGHAMAAGLTVKAERVDELRDFLDQRLGAAVAAAAERDGLGFDGAMAVAAATPDLLEILGQAGPFGSGNPEPRFALPGARVVKADTVGGDHVRCFVTGPAGGPRLKAIAFRAHGGPLGPALLNHQGAGLHLGGHLRADNWRGETRIQFVIEDAAPALGAAGPDP